MSEKLYTVNGAANELNVNVRHIRILIEYGFLRPMKKTNSWTRYVTLQQVRDAEKAYTTKPEGWVDTHEAKNLMGVSEATFNRYVKQYDIPSRRFHKLGRPIRIFQRTSVELLKKIYDHKNNRKSRQLLESLPPIQPSKEELKARKRADRMRQWLDRQDVDRHERDLAEAKKWSIFPLQLAAQKQAIEEGKRRLAEKRKEENRNDIRSTRINILE